MLTRAHRGLVPLLLLPAFLGLTACSGEDDDADDAADAQTVACRTYVLEVAGQDTRVEQLVDKLGGSGSWSNAALATALERVRVAATDAGLVEDLSEADYELYLDVAEATTRVDANPSTYTLAALKGAVDRAREACTSG